VSTLNVDKVDPSTGTTLELGTSGDTVNLGSGVTAGTGFGGDLSFGGDTFGANKVIGANDAYSFSLETSGNTALTIDSTGAITKPLQPSFLVNSSVSQALANAGNETIDFTSEIKDANADYDGTNTFTAPVTGLYAFASQVVIDAGTSTDTEFQVARLKFVCSNRTAQMYNMEMESGADDRLGLNASVFIDMDASDTAYIEVTFTRVTGTGATNTVVDATTMYTFFTGYLIC